MSKSRRIMWLEDDGYFVRKLMRPLEELGFDVKMYGDAASFLADLTDVPSASLIVIDLLVPSGLEDSDARYAGLSVLRTVSSIDDAPPVVVFSVVAGDETLQDVRKYTTHILTKPVPLERFTTYIKQLLPASPPESTHG